MVEADFSGYATKAGLKCSDGRTIMRDAFEHQDKARVPLVWQHGHSDPENILGHAILENREDGVYCHGYFNSTNQGNTAKDLVQHGDITYLSIYANQLVERAKQVFHGSIREVSLVLAGANPGAMIDNVSVSHGDGIVEDLEDEAIIYTGVPLEQETTAESTVEHAADSSDNSDDNSDDNGSSDADGPTVQDVYDSMTDEQKEVVNFMVGAAIEAVETSGAAAQSATTNETADNDDKDATAVQHGDTAEDSTANRSDNNEGDLTHHDGTEDMSRNVFEQNGSATGTDTKKRATLSHDQLKTIVDDAKNYGGSLKESFFAHAQDYGIEDIDLLFPDAQSVTSSPDFISRRMDWVASVIDGAKHSPFSRIKSMQADITADEARAKGYVKGNLKKDEIIKLLKRVTTPTTIYKKQKLDRDDVVDITELDVVAWLKAEMRVMLDEELARAVLIGDGREADDDDKIDEDAIRPIAFDDDMYSSKVIIQSNAAPEDYIEAIIRARKDYKGSGRPTFYTTDDIITDLLLIKDKMNRYVYDDETALANKLRVTALVPVEVMENEPDIIGIMVNMTDYTLGADRGGNVSMFDDFDIDYNQFKYLIETRVSGALTKPKAAVVVSRTSGTTVTPDAPTYNATTHVVTIPSKTGVDYYIDDEVVTGTVTISETTDVEARPSTGYSFPHNTDDDWTFAYTA